LLGIIFLVVIAFVWIAKPPFQAKSGPSAEAAGGIDLAVIPAKAGIAFFVRWRSLPAKRRPRCPFPTQEQRVGKGQRERRLSGYLI
jgi:hypothetical protein